MRNDFSTIAIISNNSNINIEPKKTFIKILCGGLHAGASGKKQMKKFRGRHLIIDAYGVKSDLLKNRKSLSNLLEDLPKKLKMRILKKPTIGKIISDEYPTWGLSGFVILYESHISFHTWPEENYVALDVYSCKDFDEGAAVDYLKKFLNSNRLKVKSIIRG